MSKHESISRLTALLFRLSLVVYSLDKDVKNNILNFIVQGLKLYEVKDGEKRRDAPMFLINY